MNERLVEKKECLTKKVKNMKILRNIPFSNFPFPRI